MDSLDEKHCTREGIFNNGEIQVFGSDNLAHVQDLTMQCNITTTPAHAMQ